jgi:hypothetical protein
MPNKAAVHQANAKPMTIAKSAGAANLLPTASQGKPIDFGATTIQFTLRTTTADS